MVLLKGAGDLGSGVAWRLVRSGFPVIITELAQPLFVRRTVAFASAVYDRQITVEGITARRVDSVQEAHDVLREGVIPVLVDPETRAREFLSPQVVVDAVMAKRNTGTRPGDAPLVVALGPGFVPGVDCHAVIETQRGHDLGRVLWDRAAEPNSGMPGEIGGKSGGRVLRAPRAGPVLAVKQIGDRVTAGEIVAEVAGAPARSAIDGIVRGLVHDGLTVQAGTKIGDVDPRAKRENCYTISDKSLAIGGGVLEAVLSWMSTRPR
ncbi:MAG: selenium-dependent molybdenum cofactor biosynthesis protein YqeB [Chloroflexi bacterium]|nr:selenium-dependent molybdenum cofactor biosynthesis protein YqeB [Chloroflexota bacterium]